jgi:hypothetical protein
MDAKLKRKWLKALRGGQYDQVEGRLCDEEGKAFCCLGVLANEQGCVWKENGDDGLAPIWPNARQSFAVMASGKREITGGLLMPRYAGGVPLAQQEKLAEMNDEGKSFAEIADYIEREL